MTKMLKTVKSEKDALEKTKLEQVTFIHLIFEQTNQIKMLVEQNAQTHRDLQSSNDELEKQRNANKLQQQMIDKLKAELEQLKKQNFEMAQLDILQ